MKPTKFSSKTSAQFSFSSMDHQQFHPATIWHSLARAPTSPCIVCGRPVRTGHENAAVRCHTHRNNVDPQVGWVWLTNIEAQIITLIRKGGWAEETLAELTDLNHHEEVERMNDRFEEISTVASPPAAPATFTEIRTQDAISDPESGYSSED